MKRAIFIDKDGTLVRDIPYNVDPALLQFTEGAITGLQQFRAMGFLLVLVSNQSGVARGFFGEKELEHLNFKMNEMLDAHGAALDAILFCPHHPQGIITPYNIECDCRKPKPGMLLQAAAKYNLNLAGSWMIGDILNDVEAGNRAGCRTILIDNGNETEWEASDYRKPTATVISFQDAVDTIVHQSEYA